MERIPVQSSSLKSVGHEGDTLEVEFSSGKVYRYAGVSREHFDGLLAAAQPDADGKPGSIGRHFNEQIRGAFEHSRVDEAADENGERG